MEKRTSDPQVQEKHTGPLHTLTAYSQMLDQTQGVFVCVHKMLYQMLDQTQCVFMCLHKILYQMLIRLNVSLCVYTKYEIKC